MFVKQFFVAAVTAVLSICAYAQYPDRPVTLVVPFGPGSGVDTVARIMQPVLEQELGVTLVVKNVSGAGGQIGTQELVISPADGYTIGISTVSTMSTNFVFRKQPYSLDSFSYVSRIGLMPRALVVNQTFPANDWKKFVAQVRASPNKYFYTTVANSVDMLDMHLITTTAGLELTAVPYPDNNSAFRIDLVSNRVQITYNSLPVLTSFLKNNDTKLLAITGQHRSIVYPDVPTFAELGIKELEAASFYGVVGPKNLKAEHITRLNQAFAKTLTNPVVVEKLTKIGIVASSSSPAEHQTETARAYTLYTKLGQKLNIQAH
jgi:tripartite-type tricarboxylate transporter receptor subunit TctC